jgi:hypothetical protein
LDPKRRQLIGRHIRGLSNIVSWDSLISLSAAFSAQPFRGIRKFDICLHKGAQEFTIGNIGCESTIIWLLSCCCALMKGQRMSFHAF